MGKDSNRVAVIPPETEQQLASAQDFQRVQKRQMQESMGDGTLFRYCGYPSYRSLAQKLLLYLLRLIPQTNQTLLACLPTGGGKSLAWQFPALSGLWPKTVIVIVPTVALSIAHEEVSQKQVLPFSRGERYAVAWPAKTQHNQEGRAQIRKDLLAGHISIFYIAPEALVQLSFKQLLLRMAAEGLLSALVIDEAHLLVSWGQSFRVEYQLLPTLCHLLREKVPNGLPVLLLSATLNEVDTKILQNLFERPDMPFCQVRGDKLREEISYHAIACKSLSREAPHRTRGDTRPIPCPQREAVIRKLLAEAPRPIILYVQQPAEADVLAKKIERWGYPRVRAFSGQTSARKREEYLAAWQDNQLDIMVATSAFGMGVDKGDVRTVITAYLPANISDYYQEVGRAGRDGYSALNYWLVHVDEHGRFLDSQIHEKILQPENFSARLQALLDIHNRAESPSAYQNNSQVMTLNMHTKRANLEGLNTGSTNVDWNMTVLLTLQRSGYAEILDFDIQGRDTYLVTVKFAPKVTTAGFYHTLESILGKEKQRRAANAKNVQALFKKISVEPAMADKDMRFALEEEFPCTEQPLTIMGQLVLLPARAQFQPLCYDEGWHVIAALQEKLLDLSSSQTSLAEQVAILVRNGVQLLVRDAWSEQEAVLQHLQWYDQQAYMMLTLDEMENFYDWRQLPAGSAAVFYTSTTARACYQQAQGLLAEGWQVWHVADGNLPVYDKNIATMVNNQIVLRERDVEVNVHED